MTATQSPTQPALFDTLTEPLRAGIVSEGAARIESSHLGFAVNVEAYRAVARALAGTGDRPAIHRQIAD